MNREEVSLGEFIKKLALRFSEAGMIMPLRDERPWHMLFYQLKSSQNPGKPAFFSDMLFDWDGPYPRSLELAEYLHTLHWSGCLSASNPQYEEVTVNPKVRELWSGIQTDGELTSFIDYSIEIAREHFNEIEDVDAQRLSNAG